MFALVLWVHSLVRWFLFGLGFFTLFRALRGRSEGRAWTPFDSRLALALVATLDMQLVIGGVLWVKSPISVLGIHELHLTLRSPVLLFWTFVHPILVLAAIAAAHIGSLRIRRQTDARRRYGAAALFFGLTLVLLLAAVPWPGLPYGRPILTALH